MIQKLNLLNKSNNVSPNYDLSNQEVYIKLYLSSAQEICITGALDNNYVVWCSLTKLNDKELNTKIFDYIANNVFDLISTEYKVLGNERYAEIRKWYVCTIRKSTLPNMYWETPFNHYYGEDKENHGRCFSRDIQQLYNELIKKCEFRDFELRYKEILKRYIELLTKEKDYQYYYEMKPLISILESESYLRISKDKDLRLLYLSCMEECYSLYNRYMTAVR